MFSKLGTRSLQSEHTTTCSTATEPACSDVRPGPRPRHQSQRALSFLSSDWSRGEEAERGESRWSLCWTTGEDSHLLHGHFLSCSLSVQQYLQHVAYHQLPHHINSTRFFRSSVSDPFNYQNNCRQLERSDNNFTMDGFFWGLNDFSRLIGFSCLEYSHLLLHFPSKLTEKRFGSVQFAVGFA